jgi:hypothetical protein
MFKVWELFSVHYALCTMVTKDEIVLVDGVGRVDGPPTFQNVTTNSSHMENFHLKLGNSLENEVLQFTTTQVQIALWKPHHCVSIF